jgi:lactate dehydrogenase-like 2-hydroxyacid dehydrogenase
MPAELWAALPNVELIASFGVGLDRIDIEMAKSRGVRVSYTPDALTDDVADLAIGLILSALRGICAGDRFIRTGGWTQKPLPLGRSLKDRRLGILGLGRIGSAIANRAAAFGMAVGYHNRTRKTDARFTYHAEVKELASHSDILCVCTPGGAGTRHLVDARVLEALGKDGYLINIARGPAVDEKALLAALENGAIAGAALDVFENEPAIDPAFFECSNVVLTPHIGSATRDTRARMADEVFANLQAFLNGRPLAGLAF